ncbi:aldolase II superfamily protein [Cupriavidus basilensis OR16]|uniref:Aldolase II superfamily protein n=1 Tax=Cupriavidus basilensis OR16 TaxID=1127483 RepID=H1SBD3_9BURK|nr:class II aldolase/adducin family protein [Cupriavidus basilensis]EHP40204.1 aldolase II superfamily protein [Cupriavidus basilensis OR16]
MNTVTEPLLAWSDPSLSLPALHFPAVQAKVSPTEWAVRVELAAAYRLAAQFRWTDHIYTHFSARVPGSDEHFLINAYGLTFEEITASNLVKVDIDGEILRDDTGLGINPAGYVIHSAIHAARHDVGCVLHTHTAAGIGVSAQRDGLLMISQHAMRFFERVAYHDYEGIAIDLDERSRLVADLGERDIFILRNHGLLTCAPTIAQAFQELHMLERACVAQLAAQSGGAPLVIAPDAVARKVAELVVSNAGGPVTRKHWAALLRQLDRSDPSYRQ